VGRERAEGVIVPKLEAPLWPEKLSVKVAGLAAGLGAVNAGVEAGVGVTAGACERKRKLSMVGILDYP